MDRWSLSGESRTGGMGLYRACRGWIRRSLLRSSPFDHQQPNGTDCRSGSVTLNTNGSEATLFSHSQYVVKGMSEWVKGWQRRNWRKSDGKPVLNDDIWKRLIQAALGRTIHWSWVEGHAGHEENERCDALANRAIDEAS